MIAVILLGFFAVFFAYLARFKGFEFGLKISFSLIFIFLALRYNFGNDYKSYISYYQNINSYTSIKSAFDSLDLELGWIMLNRFFNYLGFFSMVFFLAIINSIIYYHFIKKYLPAKFYWLAVFLYIFNAELMLVESSAMRQTLALVIFLYSIDFLIKKDAIRYFICIGVASLFHISAIVLLPLYLLSIFNFQIKRIFLIVIFSVYILCFFLLVSIGQQINQVVNVFVLLKGYIQYQDAAVLNTGIGIIFLSLIFLIILYYEKFQNRDISIIFKISFLKFILIPLTLIILILSRIGMYFDPLTIVVYPLIAISINNKYYRLFFVSLIISVTIINFIQFYHSATYAKPFNDYHTIFSAPKFL